MSPSTSLPGRRPSTIDGILAGIVVALVILTVYSFGKQLSGNLGGDRDLPSGAAKKIRFELRDKNDHQNFDIGVSAGLTEGLLRMFGKQAVVRFDQELDDSDLDLPATWNHVKALSEGESWTDETHGKRITAKRIGPLVEIQIVEPEHRIVTSNNDVTDSDDETEKPSPPDDETAKIDEKPNSPHAGMTPPKPPSPPKMAGTEPFPPGSGKKDSSPRIAENGPDQTFETVTIRLPVSILEKLDPSEGSKVRIGNGKRVRFSLAEAVRELRKLGPTEILAIESSNETVRISLE